MSKRLEDVCPTKIEDEYKKNSQLKPDDLAEFRNWCTSKPNFPKNIPEVLLSLFLHNANYKVDVAKKFLENSLKLRSNTPEFFNDRDPDSESMKTILELIGFCVSKEKTPDNYRVIHTCFLNSDATNYNFGDACKAFLMVGEWYVLNYGSTPGVVIVMDAKGGTYRHLFKAKINLIMKFLSYIQDALPVTIRQVHIVNVIPVIDKAMFLARPFIRKELLDNIFFHSGNKLEEVYKKVPRESLPMELGGKEDSQVQLQKETIENLRKMKEWFTMDEKLLRLSKHNDSDASNVSEIASNEITEESFQNLSID